MDLPKKFMAQYGRVIERYLGIPDETMSPAARRRLEEAPALTRVDLDGLFGIKPEPAMKDWFNTHRLPIIFQETLKGSASALYHAVRNPFQLEYEDADIAYLLNHTYFGRLIAEGPEGQPLLDLAHHEHLQTLPGFYSHGIKAFLRRDGGRYELDRLEISGRSITRAHRSWPLAKIYLLIGMDNETLFTDHAVGHLNNNFIEAAAKRTLSERNPLRVLLAPHCSICIPLDELIMELFHKHTSPGNPFAFPVRSLYELINKGFRDDVARGLSPVYADTSYNRALGDAHRIIHDLVGDCLERNLRLDSPAFAEIRAFSDVVRESIPYFPRGEDLDLDDVETIAARFIHESTFVSSTDHIITRSDLGYFRSIFRIRRPFAEDASWRMTDLFHPIDTYQRIVFRNVFSGDHCASLLKDVEYDPALGMNLAPFKDRLRDLERRHPALFPLDRIGATIDI